MDFLKEWRPVIEIKSQVTLLICCAENNYMKLQKPWRLQLIEEVEPFIQEIALLEEVSVAEKEVEEEEQNQTDIKRGRKTGFCLDSLNSGAA